MQDPMLAAYGWAKKYAVVMLGEQPVLVFKDKAPVGEEAAGGNTPRSTTAQACVSPQGSAFEDLYAVHMAGVHCTGAGLSAPRVCKVWQVHSRLGCASAR